MTKRVLIASTLGAMNSHPDYAAAKGGDVVSSLKVAKAMLTDDFMAQIGAVLGRLRPLVLPVISEEVSGRNKIPLAAAELLAFRLGLQTETRIVQANKPMRTALSGLERLFSSPVFSGPVVLGQTYLMLDDTLTQGGTFAALSSYLKAHGGRPIAAVALSGKRYSADLAITPVTLDSLRNKHGDLEPSFVAATGYGYDELTESEARYLSNFKPVERMRDRIVAGGRGSGKPVAEGSPA
ncbi:phosphoribosyltransferase [Kerstersia sp.]|uniref:phosphoribosyltransferase n=1 Tax=Kerstersia sp. TaxID=1930783 RepID=UPI003F8DD317